MNQLVSILIPAFNASKWISDTIKSALAQTWPRKEIVIVDDGSTDTTLAVAREFESTEVKVITQPNAGAAAARNRAYSECQGDFIQWLDADDLLDPDKIKSQLQPFEKSSGTRTLLSSAWGRFIYRAHRAQFVPTPLWADLTPVEWFLLNLKFNYWMQTSVWLVSRELTEQAGPWDTRLSVDDDGEYFCRVMRASDKIRFCPHSKMFYRRVPDSLSYVDRSPRKVEAHFLAMELRIRHALALENSSRMREAGLELLKASLIAFYPDFPDILARAQQLATELGARDLGIPKLSWKYAGIQRCCGWTAARQAQLRYNRFKSSVLRCLDRSLLLLGM